MMDADILNRLEARVARAGDAVCFVDASDNYAQVTYRQLRQRAAWMARALQRSGIGRGDWCVIDMDNCPALVYALFAAAYGGFSLVMLNTRLTESEKDERVREVEQARATGRLRRLDEAAALDLLRVHAEDLEDATAAGKKKRRGKARVQEAHAEACDLEHLPASAAAALSHWAQRGVGAFDGLQDAVAMFTSGTSGKPKAAALSWNNLCGAATASNASLNTPGEGLWQLALPLYHVGGLEIVFRSLLNGNPYMLYRRFDARQMLRDAHTYSATHVSVVDKMLQDMLNVAEEAVDACLADGAEAKDDPVAASHQDGSAAEALAAYECILLGGAAPNVKTLERARAAGARVFASYGMTETCSQVASALVTKDYAGALAPLPGYDVTVLAPDESGLGRLAVKGPGVFDGYLNARAAFTADGYFLTGDSARMQDRHVVVAERTGDMFVSGGENIYPEEIRSKLLQAPDVTDAYVFGLEDPDWGRRPVAFVEAAQAARRPGFNPQVMAEEVRVSLAARIARIYMPDHIAVIPEFPRTGIGKVDRVTLRLFYAERLEVKRVEMWRIKQPLRTPVRTAKVRLRERESLIVRVTDAAGRTGIGEDVAFSTNWYLPETIDQDIPVLEKLLAPQVLKHMFLHPSQIGPLFNLIPGAKSHPLACSAMENALWDLYGKVMGRSVRRLIEARDQVSEPGAERPVPAGSVLGGAVVGIAPVSDVLRSVQDAVDVGYARVKLKIKPGHDVKVVRAVRERFPQLIIMLDANQSYTENDVDVLRELQECDIACIEEPLDPAFKPSVGPQDLFARLARLQRQLSMPICLDESWVTVDQLEEQLTAHPELRCVAMKLGKFGGVQQALEFYRRARTRGIALWMGGMYDTGVSKRLHAAFAMLPGMNIPGDLSDTARYFSQDITDPPFVLEGGQVVVNPQGFEAGLGCQLNEAVLNELAVQKWVWPEDEACKPAKETR